MRVVPESNFQSEVSSTKYGEVAESVALPDTLKTGRGPLSISSQVNGRHPLENRLKNWEKTQNDLKLESYKRIFGAAEPIRRVVELNVVDNTDFQPSSLGPASNIHRDILLNKDASVDWEDVYSGHDEEVTKDFHSELEGRLGL